MMLPMVAMADAVEINGIYYNLITKTKTAEVTTNPNKYKGAIVIPFKVTYNEEEWNVTSIGQDAFYSCKALTSITIPYGITSIGSKAFYFCTALTSISIPNSVTDIGNEAFAYCTALTTISIPNSVINIGRSAFSNCTALASIFIPNSVTNIEGFAFFGCTALTSITIPNSITSIKGQTFKNCASLATIAIPNSVTSIGLYAFESCTSLTSVSIPNSVTNIDGYAFRNCSSLIDVTLGTEIKSIGKESFANCKELLNIYCYSEKVPTTYSDAFSGSDQEFISLHVPYLSIDKYKATSPWNMFKEVVAIEKCETPTISYSNGRLTFKSVTEGVYFKSTITDSDITSYSSDEVLLCMTYNISVYATRTGYNNSDVATAILCWIDRQPQTEGITNEIANIPARALLIKSNGGQLTVEGADDSEQISVYSTNGIRVGTAISNDGKATVNTTLQKGDIAIVNIGQKVVKVVIK